MSAEVSTLRGINILVVSMTTWGEMGNWLSGKSLGATLAACIPNATIQVEPAETLVPRFQSVGAAIKAATLTSQTPQERFERYAAVLHALEPAFPAGFEAEPSRFPEVLHELQPLAAYLRRTQPDVVIGTKGVICRAVQSALRLAGLDRPVINYVTNHGHYQFPVHRCSEAALHLVRFPEGKDYLQAMCGWPEHSIRVVGYLIAAQQLLQGSGGQLDLPDLPTPRRSVIIVSNRGGREYVTLLERLRPYGDAIDVTFIAIRDAELCQLAAQVVNNAGVTSWRIVEQLSQHELFRLMVQARQQGICMLVCKASPNSIFEAAYFGLPMFLLRTGLPMEEWGADMVVREQLGWVAETMDQLVPHLTACLGRPETLATVQAGLRAFADRYLDQEQTVRRLLQAIQDVATQ